MRSASSRCEPWKRSGRCTLRIHTATATPASTPTANRSTIQREPRRVADQRQVRRRDRRSRSPPRRSWAAARRIPRRSPRASGPARCRLEELALADDLRELACRPARSRCPLARGRRGGPPAGSRCGARPGARPAPAAAATADGEQRGAQRPVRRRTSSVSAGSTWKRSPTTPRSASLRIGASGSFVMATMRREPFMPTACCSAPLMPADR